MRVLVNRLLAGLEVETVEQEEDQDEDSSAAAMETGNGEKRVIKKVPVLASAVLKMLKRILEKDGELMSDGSTW